MAESGGLPSWVEAWVGKVVQVHVHGDPDPLFGVLPVVCCNRSRAVVEWCSR
jgi:hypothetical protein